MDAPRALRHFSLAAMEGRAHRVESPDRPKAIEVRAPMVEPTPSRTVVRLWLPATLIFLLLAPFALLLAPLLHFAPRPYSLSPLAIVLGVGQLLLSLGGTVVDVDTPDALVSIRIL
jgi:hypothetical protein